MGFFLRALSLAIVWAALQGAFSLPNLVFGLGVGAAVVWFVRPLYELSDPRDQENPIWGRGFALRLVRMVVLVLVFLKELLLSGVRVAREVLRPTLRIQPGVIAYPLDVRTGREITVLANLISLTPGTLSLEVSDDRQVLFIHALLVENEEATEVRKSIKQSLEKHVARALGPEVEGWSGRSAAAKE